MSFVGWPGAARSLRKQSAEHPRCNVGRSWLEEVASAVVGDRLSVRVAELKMLKVCGWRKGSKIAGEFPGTQAQS